MSTKEKLSAEETGRRIVAAISQVHGLYMEMVGFFRLLVQELEASDLEIEFLSGNLSLFRQRKRRTLADPYLKTDMGKIAILDSPGEDEDEGDDVEPDDSDDSDDEKQAERKGIMINSDSRFIALRAILYEPKIKTDFTPVIVAAVLSDLKYAPRSKSRKPGRQKSPLTSFKITRGGLMRVYCQLEPELSEGQRIAAKIRGAELSATIGAVLHQPLGEFDSEESVSKFVDAIVEKVDASGGGSA